MECVNNGHRQTRNQKRLTAVTDSLFFNTFAHPLDVYAALCALSDAKRRKAYEDIQLSFTTDPILRRGLPFQLVVSAEDGLPSVHGIHIRSKEDGTCVVKRGRKAAKSAVRRVTDGSTMSVGMLVIVEGHRGLYHQHAVWITTTTYTRGNNRRKPLVVVYEPHGWDVANQTGAIRRLYNTAAYTYAIKTLFRFDGCEVYAPVEWQRPVEGQGCTDDSMCFLWCLAWLCECASYSPRQAADRIAKKMIPLFQNK